MMDKATPAAKKARGKLTTYTVKVAGIFVVRAQAMGAKAARDKVLKTVNVGSGPNMCLDDSLVTVGSDHNQPTTIKRSLPVRLFYEGNTADAAEVLSYLVACESDPTFIKVRKVEGDLKKILGHLRYVRGHGYDENLQLAGNEVMEAAKLVASARARLVQRSRQRLLDGYTPGPRDAA